MMRKLFIYLIALVLSALILFGAGYLTVKEYLRNEDQIKADFTQLLDFDRLFYYEVESNADEAPEVTPEQSPVE